MIIKVSGYQLLNEDSFTQSEWVTEDVHVHCPSSAVRFMHSTQGRIHLQSSCQSKKFIWSELRFPRTLPPPHAKFTGNFSSERSKYVTGGGSNNREVPPLIQKLTGPKAYNWQTFQSEAVEKY